MSSREQKLREIAEGLQYDLQHGDAMPALRDLDAQAITGDMPNYKKWRAAFETMKKEFGIIYTPARGIHVDGDLKPEGFDALTLSEMHMLVEFSTPDKDGTRKSIDSERARIFLKKFHMQVAPVVQEMLSEESAATAARSFQKWWRDALVVFKIMLDKDCYKNFETTVSHLNRTAEDPRFGYFFKSGGAAPADFVVDPEKLVVALRGEGPEGDAINGLLQSLFSMTRQSDQLGDSFNAMTLRTLRGDYEKNVKPKLHQAAADDVQLALVRGEKSATNAGRVWF